MPELNDIARALAELDAFDMKPVLTGRIAEIVGRRNVSMDLEANPQTLEAKVLGDEADFTVHASVDVADTHGNETYDVVVKGRLRRGICELAEIHGAA